MEQKIEYSLVVIGNVHSDFTLAPVLTRVFSNLHKTKIPCVFLEEGPSDQTLTQAVESTSRGVQQSRIFKQLFPELLSLYKPIQSGKQTYQHLDKAAHAGVKSIVKDKIMPLIGKDPKDENFIEQITLEFFRENAYIEEIKLYKKLQTLNLPYASIDLSSDQYDETIMSGSANPQKFIENETIRINAMVKNTFKSLTHIPHGGLVIITVGNTHAHRLAANILLAHQNNLFSTEHCQLNIHPLSLTSFCIEDWKTDQYGLEITQGVDSSEIKDIYNKLPIVPVSSEIKENGFSIPAFEELVLEFMRINSSIQPSLSSPSFFKPSTHDLLVCELKDVLQKKPSLLAKKVVDELKSDKNYSLALRKLCALGNIGLIEILLNYSDKVLIDFKQTSSNGKTALDWLETSNIPEEDKTSIKSMIIEKMNTLIENHQRT